MNELFTDFKKQFQKLKTSHEKQDGDQASQDEGGMEFDDSKKKGSASKNYVVNIMYDKFFVRKQEIADNILMIAICDV